MSYVYKTPPNFCHHKQVKGFRSFQIIDHCDGADSLKRREAYWIHELKTMNPWGINARDELNGVDVGVPRGQGRAGLNL